MRTMTKERKKEGPRLGHKGRADTKASRQLLLLCIPAIIGYILFNYIPMGAAVIIPFKNYKFSKGILGSDWCGLANFKWIIQSVALDRALRNTVLYGLLFMVLSPVTNVIIALLLFEITSRRRLKTYQTIITFPNFMSMVIVGYIVYAIPYCADEPERAMMVLNAIYSQPDLYNTLIYGIEGEDYTKNADGTITTSYVGASPTADDSYGIQRWIIGSCKNALINNGTDPNYYADLEALEETARVNPFMNFTFDRTNVEGICASILNVYYEYGPQLDNGVAGDNWEELYNNYMAARKDAGIEELVTEFQNQLNAYIEANNITSW